MIMLVDNPHWVINIDVDEMKGNKTVTLTVYNLTVGELLDDNEDSLFLCEGLLETKNLMLNS